MSQTFENSQICLNSRQSWGNENDFSKGTAKPRDNRGRDDQRGYNVDQNLWKQEDT